MGIQINGQTDTVTAADGSLNLGGNVTIPGVLTYEDVTSVDAIGLSTFQNGIHVTGGSVGIGTDNPATTLDISGNIRLSASDPNIQLNDGGPRLRVPIDNTLTIHTGGNLGTNDFERLRITSTGSVGIGTDNPGVAGIDILANSAAVRCRESGGADARLVSGGSISYFGTYSNHDLQVLTNGSNALRITSSGNVGIGLTNPSTKLHLSSGTATQIMISNISSTMSDGDTIGTIDFAAGPSNTVNARVAGAVEGTSEAGGDLVFETRADGGSLTEKLRIDSSGNVTIPNIPLLKTNVGNVYGSSGSLTTSPLPATAILQSSAEIDRGNNGWTTSGSNAYTFVCPVTGIYAVHAHMSLDDIAQGNRIIFTMAYTLGGGNLPLASYVEVMDVNMDDYMNYSYYNTWNFTAGTRVGFGINGTSGTVSGIFGQWGIHLIA